MIKIFFLFFMWNSVLLAQTNYVFPIDIPIILSSNFGELRASHFHSGLDIKTKGRVGWPVKSVAQGYVSRIKISSGGYGRAIYINHPDGHTSVYAHLKEFSPKLEQIVLKKQIQLKMSELELYFAYGFIPVAKSEVIGISGNSGHSGGPHLHFEIRDTKTEFALNALAFLPKIKDYQAPIIQKLYLYNLPTNKFTSSYNRREIPLNYVKKSMNNALHTIYVSEYSAFAVKSLDKMTNSPNHFGIYNLKFFLDSTLKFQAEFDSFSFLETRGINALMDYELFKKKGIKIYRLFQSPNNSLTIYKKMQNNGIIHLVDYKKHFLKIVLTDYDNNETHELFYIQRSRSLKFSSPKLHSYLTDYHFSNTKITVQIPAFSSFYDFPFSVHELNIKYSPWSSVFQVGNSYIPLKNKIIISFSIQNVPTKLKSKLYAVYMDTKGRQSSNIGFIHNSHYIFYTFNFGKYFMQIDTIAPRAVFLNKINGVDYQCFNYKIYEKSSGLAYYKAFIAGKWARVYYDSKYRRLSVYRKNTDKQTKSIVISLRDKCGNFRKQVFVIH